MVIIFVFSLVLVTKIALLTDLGLEQYHLSNLIGRVEKELGVQL